MQIVDNDWMRPWELLRSGDVEPALDILRKEYEKRGRFKARETLSLGIAYMWAQQFESASSLFTAAARAPFNGENDFAYAGVAEWHLGNGDVAIQRWREGLKAQYAVGGRVCSMTARLLVVASALEPDLCPKAEAQTVLRDAVERIDSSGWSGALGNFLGHIDSNEMKSHCIGYVAIGVKGILPHHIWLTDFYAAARRLGRSEINVQDFRSLMRSLVDIARSEKTDTDAFSRLLRNPEYFFAQSEGAKK